MPRISDWPPAKPPLRSYVEVVAEIDRRRVEAECARKRRLEDLTLAGVWLLGLLLLVVVAGFMLF